MRRREALRLAGAAGLAVVFAAPARAAPRRDAALLANLLRLEHRAAATYEAVAASGAMPEAEARRLREQDRAHADKLAAALRDLGRRPARPLRGPEDVPGLVVAVERGRRSILRFVLALERRTVASYDEAIGALRDQGLRAVAASIMASDAQHLVLLREALGQEPVPSALERGIH